MNKYRKEKGSILVGHSVIHSTVQGLQLLKCWLHKIPQGSNNPFKWAQAGFLHAKLMLICLRLLSLPIQDPETDNSEDKDLVATAVGFEPLTFDFCALGELTENQIVFFNETHKACKIENIPQAQGQDYIYFAKNNKYGNLDLENGTYAETEPTKFKCKYDNKIKLLLGVAAVKYKDKHVQGFRCHAFSYINKTVLADKDFQHCVNDKISKIKALPRDSNEKRTAGGTKSTREEGTAYKNDELHHIKGIVAKTKRILNSLGLTSVSQLCYHFSADKAKKHFVKSTKGIGWRGHDKWCNQGETDLPGSAPPDTDFNLNDNPFKSQYRDS